jgi:hypothetical protein
MWLTIDIVFTIEIFKIKNPNAEPKKIKLINYLAFVYGNNIKNRQNF